MSLDTTATLHELLRALPALEADTELILRPVAAGATATLRRTGAPPRIFTLTDAGALHELSPALDQDLPGAALLADPTALARHLEPHLGALSTARLCAWRPGRRAVLQLRTADGTEHWLKLLDRKSFRRASAAFAAVGEPLGEMRLQTPHLLLPSSCGYVAAAADGTPLRTLLAGADAPPLTMLARALVALPFTAVHGELPIVDFERVRAASLQGLAQGALLRPELQSLAAAIAELPAPRPPARTGFVHGDLHDKQLFLAEDRATLIDLEGMAVGDPRFDLANLVEHVRLRDLQQHGADSGLAEALLARCGITAEDSAVRAFRALVRARLCGVYALRPRWRELVARLQLEAMQLMELRP
ncbi:MAG: aminoglycoside phosphotransferase family protein [Planctomycetes bacterium]|jgi:hypothetical protein|nr:aminoglycoside phosphotransferase family protein [Planctomycetota bacterium]